MDYMTYKLSIVAQGSYCYLSPEAYAEAQRKIANGHEVVYDVTSTTARLPRGWYKNVFAPGEIEPLVLGPVATEAEAYAL